MTLLLSLIVLSMVLTASLGVFNILITGLKLSATTRDSQLAFYASDAGVECALYVDLATSNYPFGTTTEPSIWECSTYENGSLNPYDGNSYVSGANFRLVFSNGSCADVRVNKGGLGTIIEAIGRNTCANIPNRVNRSIRVEY